MLYCNMTLFEVAVDQLCPAGPDAALPPQTH